MPRATRWIARLCIGAFVAPGLACQDGTESSCRPGEKIPCECTDGAVGHRSCVEDLLIWGACECDGAGGSTAGAAGGTSQGASGGQGGAGGGGGR